MVVAPEAKRGVLAAFYRLKYFLLHRFLVLWRIANFFFFSFIYLSALPFSFLYEMSKPVTLIGPVIHKGPRRVLINKVRQLARRKP
jgi:hypothetical protein